MLPHPSACYEWRPGWQRMMRGAPQTPLFDIELGQIFLKMRTLLGVSLWDMARAVGGEPTVIANLEAGAIEALPPWPELTRLIYAYAALTGVDPQPILARLVQSQPAQPTVAPPAAHYGDDYAMRVAAGWDAYARENALRPNEPPHRSGMSANMQVDPAEFRRLAPPQPLRPTQEAAVTRSERAPEATQVRSGGPRAASSARVAVQTATVAGDTKAATSRSGSSGLRRAAMSTGRGLARALRRRVGLGMVLVLPLLVVGSARFFPALLYDVVNPLPGVVMRPLRRGVDQLVVTFAPSREGLIWIDVGDPRLRKSDKLREPGR